MQLDFGDFEGAFYLDFSPLYGEDAVEMAVKKQGVRYLPEPGGVLRKGSEQPIVTFTAEQLFAMADSIRALAVYASSSGAAERRMQATEAPF